MQSAGLVNEREVGPGKAGGLEALFGKVLDVVKPEPTEAVPLPEDSKLLLLLGV